tara:strand:- start:1659 stop:1898 length:240 start_codon:yes stop_codon:yes gene_type:complete
MSDMLIVTLTLTTIVSILALLVGGMIGWMARQHSYETTPQVVYSHPEMFDSNGNVLPDEIVALRIENNHDIIDTDEDDD